MITNTMLIKKLRLKSADRRMILELIKSDDYFKKESVLSNKEFEFLLRLQISN
ncbi:hypothetical protein [uncultured Tenacibaculum sp.]|uniref:hypothetical protein n=1 Tax=uncultured Tenacibaculum sp. TaxID=174713 RepID=UPI002607B622|nr:hypothetical protein [uncultured Tenacibaculum sp.]